MNIGIIIHSKTNNTWSVAEKLRDQLVAQGHQVGLERIVAVDDQQAQAAKVTFSACPDASGYDALVIGAPVRAFTINPIINAYLSQLPHLGAKPTACFVTKHLKQPWLGGNKAIRRMSKLCADKGLEVKGSSIVSWSSPERESQINACVTAITALF
ncbi:MAG: flavodoxin [Bacillota bacterium]|nr:flavodoxin [Bacillota bacterium]